MLAIEDLLNANRNTKAFEIEIAVYYEKKDPNDPDDRYSSRLAPHYVRYSVYEGNKSVHFYMWARCENFDRKDAVAVQSELHKVFTGVITTI